MLTFKQFLSEGKVLDSDRMVIHEPSISQLHSIIEKSPHKEVRAIHHPVHGLFAWDASRMTHDDMRDHLNYKHGFNMEYGSTHRFFVGKNRNNDELLLHHSKDDDYEGTETTHSPAVNHPTIKKIKHARNLGDYESNVESPY